MLRVDRRGPGLTVVSRLGRPRTVAVLAAALGIAAWAAFPFARAASAARAAAAALVALLGGRAVRARFERGRVRVLPAIPFAGADDRPLREFAGARIETIGEARRRRAEDLAGRYRARSGAEMPSWLVRSPDAPGANDHLRRIVLVACAGDPLPVTAWLAADDLEPVRSEVEALMTLASPISGA
jgi:hypothetical protein